MKLYELSGYASPFFEVDCSAAADTLTVYQTYTNDAAQSVTPQVLILTTTAAGSTTTMTQAAASQATGGTVVNCGNGGSGGSGSGGGGVTCNVGGGNNGNDAKQGVAPRSDGGLMIRALIWWIAMELFRWGFS